MKVLVNQPFRLDDRDDVDYLAERLQLERRADGLVIQHAVGHLCLPSGRLLEIRSPKASTAALLTWFSYVEPSLRQVKFLGRLPHAIDDGELAGLVARVYVHELTTAAATHGLVRSYRRTTHEGAALRGRVEFSTLARRGGDLSRLPCVVWERLPATPLNGLLAAALEHVRADDVMRNACGPLLHPATELLAPVTPNVAPDWLREEQRLGRDERAYVHALALARLILRHAAVSEGARRRGVSFLFDINVLFERSVVTALREAGVKVRAHAPIAYRRVSAGRDREAHLEADLYCPDFGGAPLVVDAKFRTAIDSDCLRQMVTYCVLLGARRGVLVVPAEAGIELRRCHFSTLAGDIRVDVVELATDAGDLEGWRANGRALVAALHALGGEGDDA